MIRKLRGRLDSLGWGHAVVDVGGVGFLVYVPLSTRQALLAARDQEVVLHVHTRVREESIELFGFAKPEELEAFELLLQVNGVGPKLGLAALSTLDPPQLYQALAEGQAEVLRRVPGIGPRLAERLCVELREKARERVGAAGAAAASDGRARLVEPSERHPAFGDAVAALVSLGYTRAEARHAVKRAAARVGPGEPLESLVRAALAAMGGSAEG